MNFVFNANCQMLASSMMKYQTYKSHHAENAIMPKNSLRETSESF